jgi:hypothetical protein
LYSPKINAIIVNRIAQPGDKIPLSHANIPIAGGMFRYQIFSTILPASLKNIYPQSGHPTISMSIPLPHLGQIFSRSTTWFSDNALLYIQMIPPLTGNGNSFLG